MLYKMVLESGFQLSVETNSPLFWFCFSMPCDWLKRLAPLSQPIRSETKTNCDLVARVFPLLTLSKWLVVLFVSVVIGPNLIALRSWFYNIQLKSALSVVKILNCGYSSEISERNFYVMLFTLYKVIKTLKSMDGPNYNCFSRDIH